MRRGGFSVTKTLHQSFNCRLLKSTISYLKSNEGGLFSFLKLRQELLHQGSVGRSVDPSKKMSKNVQNVK